MMPVSRRVELIFALFMVSGFGGLIYESVWTHYLQLFLGHAAYAQTLVLVVFIGGLALGAWICARMASRIANPLRWYAAVELAVGLMALVFHPVFVGATEWAYGTLLPAACHAERSFCAPQWLLSALLLAPQSILIGATFPLVSSAVLRLDPAIPGHHVAMLYFVNSLGAVFGVLASVFVLIPALGLPGTLAFAGAANIALAAGAFALARSTPPAFAVAAAEAGPSAAPSAARGVLRLLLATAFLTGLSSFIYEIVWIRMLSLVLGASTYSFELMLASFILGIALGGLWVRRRIDEIDDPVRFLAAVQVVMGVAAAATLPLYHGSFDFMAWLLSSVARNEGGFVLFNLASVAIALLVMLPATFCAGMTLPLITYRLLRSSAGERALGLVYSVNTFGSIAGVIVAVHLLIVPLGARGTLLVAAAIDVALGIVLLASRIRAGAPRGRGPWAAAAGIAALVLVAIVFPTDLRRSASGVFRTGIARLAPGTAVTYHRDGKTATVDVIDDGHVRAIRTNGKTDAAIEMSAGVGPTADEMTMTLLSLLPLAHRPDAKTAAIIGFGSGMSTAVMLRSPTIERVDTIEIEPAMVQGARAFFQVVAPAFSDPRSHVVIDDAKSYFARGRQRYDIVVSEPSNPWVSGVASLFTAEFYARLSESMNDGAVLSQWLHTYEMDGVTLASIFNAVGKTFPNFVAYASNESDIVLIARKGGPVGALDPSVLRWPAMQAPLARLKLVDPAVLERRALGSSRSILALFGPMGVPANSDYRPLVEERASKTRFTQEHAGELVELQAADMPLLEMLDGSFRASDRRADSLSFAAADRMAADAWGFHDMILDPAYAPGAAPPADSREHSARLIALWAERCPAEIGFERLLPSMLAMAQGMNPHLGRAAALEVWRRLEGSPCARKLSEADRRWIALFAAVAARDAQAMRRVGGELLDANRGRRTPMTEYAFEATLTGAICEGHTVEADRLFEAGTRDWLPAGGGSIALRYLYAMAHAPGAPGRPRGAACGAR